MINVQDQEQLFRLISDYIKKDLECLAIGGTAMMFYGYKAATKDIDLVFKTAQDRQIFIEAIKELGYGSISMRNIYDDKRVNVSSRPLLFSRGEERFDLFTETVFGFKPDLSAKMAVQRHDFLGRHEIILYLPAKEQLILLKAITGRPTDLEDIEAIVKSEKVIDWDIIVREAIRQKKSLPWILIDLEETLQKLKKITFIKKRYFDMLFKAQ
jgi:hypothetical protein